MPLFEGFLHGERCFDCQGVGKTKIKTGNDFKLIECRRCKGCGLTHTQEPVCSVCHGKGEDNLSDRWGNPVSVPCLKCWGTGVEPQSHREENFFIQQTKAIIESAVV